MARRNFYSKLRRLVRGPVGVSKFPLEAPRSMRQQKAWDRFAKNSYNIYQSSLAGSGERYQRYRDYELMEYTPELASALDIYADDTTTSFSDTIEDKRVITPDIFMEKKERKKIIRDIIQDLTNQEKNIRSYRGVFDVFLIFL